MSEHKAHEARKARLEREREGKVGERAMILAVVAGGVYPLAARGFNDFTSGVLAAISTARDIVDQAAAQAEIDVPPVTQEAIHGEG